MSLSSQSCTVKNSESHLKPLVTALNTSAVLFGLGCLGTLERLLVFNPSSLRTALLCARSVYELRKLSPSTILSLVRDAIDWLRYKLLVEPELELLFPPYNDIFSDLQ